MGQCLCRLLTRGGLRACIRQIFMSRGRIKGNSMLIQLLRPRSFSSFCEKRALGGGSNWRVEFLPASSTKESCPEENASFIGRGGSGESRAPMKIERRRGFC